MITCENSYLLADYVADWDDPFAAEYEVRYYVQGSCMGHVMYEHMGIWEYSGKAPEIVKVPRKGWIGYDY